MAMNLIFPKLMHLVNDEIKEFNAIILTSILLSNFRKLERFMIFPDEV